MPKAIVIEEDDIRIRFEQDKDVAFKWHMFLWQDDHWIGPVEADYDARDLLWQCAATIGVGAIANPPEAPDAN